MALITKVIRIDDLDGTQLDEGQGETVRFSLDGTAYELDLSDANAAAMREAFDRYTQAARKVGSANRAARVTGRRSSSDVDPRAVRAWASSNGVEVSARGRIPASVIDAYKAAGN